MSEHISPALALAWRIAAALTARERAGGYDWRAEQDGPLFAVLRLELGGVRYAVTVEELGGVPLIEPERSEGSLTSTHLTRKHLENGVSQDATRDSSCKSKVFPSERVGDGSDRDGLDEVGGA